MTQGLLLEWAKKDFIDHLWVVLPGYKSIVTYRLAARNFVHDIPWQHEFPIAGTNIWDSLNRCTVETLRQLESQKNGLVTSFHKAANTMFRRCCRYITWVPILISSHEALELHNLIYPTKVKATLSQRVFCNSSINGIIGFRRGCLSVVRNVIGIDTSKIAVNDGRPTFIMTEPITLSASQR